MTKFKELFSTFKEDYLFWLLFTVFTFLWVVSTVIFIAFCNNYNLPFKDAIGAYTNLLVFDATIFAPLAAYFFIDNWKEQKNKTFFSMEAKNLWLQLQKAQDYSYTIDRLIDEHDIEYYNQFVEFEAFFEKLTITLNAVHYFIELTDDKEIATVNDQYIDKQNRYEIVLKSFKFNKDQDDTFREELIEVNRKIRKLLKNYIIIK